jgi:hypothetical protein
MCDTGGFEKDKAKAHLAEHCPLKNSSARRSCDRHDGAVPFLGPVGPGERREGQRLADATPHRRGVGLSPLMLDVSRPRSKAPQKAPKRTNAGIPAAFTPGHQSVTGRRVIFPDRKRRAATPLRVARARPVSLRGRHSLGDAACSVSRSRVSGRTQKDHGCTRMVGDYQHCAERIRSTWPETATNFR